MQNKTGSGAPFQLDLSDQEHHTSAVTAIPKLLQSSSPAGLDTGSLQIASELHCVPLIRTTRPGSTRAQVVLYKPAQFQPNRCWAKPGSTSPVRFTLAPCRATWMCLHHPAQCLWDGALLEVGKIPAAPAGPVHTEDAPVLTFFCSSVL